MTHKELVAEMLSKTTETQSVWDRTLQEILDLRQQLDWVRYILANHGYDGPLGDGCCPLAEWLNEREKLRRQLADARNESAAFAQLADQRYDEAKEFQKQLATSQKSVAMLRDVLNSYDGSHSIDQWDENVMPSRSWDKTRIEALAATEPKP